MQRHISVLIEYSLADVHAAAEFVWNNNRYARNWTASKISLTEHIIDTINSIFRSGGYATLRKLITDGKDIDYWHYNISTGGYSVYYSISDCSTEDIIIIDTTIYVEPAVSWPYPRGVVNNFVEVIKFPGSTAVVAPDC